MIFGVQYRDDMASKSIYNSASNSRLLNFRYFSVAQMTYFDALIYCYACKHAVQKEDLF